jgi:DNA-binding PadR family transcriptional regulator
MHFAASEGGGGVEAAPGTEAAKAAASDSARERTTIVLSSYMLGETTLVETSTALTTTEYAVLGLLAFGERSGYDLARAADRSIGFIWTPSRSQIYKVLPRLVERGVASSREVEQQRRPDKALYRVTPAGMRVLRAWIDDVDEDPAGGSSLFLLKILFGGFTEPAAVAAQLTAYRDYAARRLQRYEEIDRNPSPERTIYGLLALQHGIAHARATTEWADRALASLGAMEARQRASRES